MRNNSVLDLDTFSVLREFCVYAKVFGERNSGTNFVQKIIQANFGVHCLQNNNPIYDYVRAASRRLPKELKGIFRSTIVDMDCQRILASDFGWKHGIPPENEILS